MFTAKIQNVKGNILTLTQNETEFQVVSIIGLNPPNAQINTSPLAGLDGAAFNSSKLETRNIVITLKLNGTPSRVEANRQLLYTYFPTKEKCTFYFQNENRNVYIEGVVDTFDTDLFQKGQTAQISIICPQPYFKAMNEIIDDVSKVISAFEFPFAFGSVGATNPDAVILPGTDPAIAFSVLDPSRITDIYNDSESSTGLIINISILNNVQLIQLQNTVTGEIFKLNYNFQAGDEITINTNKGAKSISMVRSAQTINIFSAIQKGSVFFQIAPGDNFFSYSVDNGSSDNAVTIVFKHYTIYRGV